MSRSQLPKRLLDACICALSVLLIYLGVLVIQARRSANSSPILDGTALADTPISENQQNSARLSNLAYQLTCDVDWPTYIPRPSDSKKLNWSEFISAIGKQVPLRQLTRRDLEQVRRATPTLFLLRGGYVAVGGREYQFHSKSFVQISYGDAPFLIEKDTLLNEVLESLEPLTSTDIRSINTDHISLKYPPIRNLGVVREHSQVECQIPIRNTGQNTLEVPSQPATSCGCILISQQYPITIPPGEVANLRLFITVPSEAFVRSLQIPIHTPETKQTILTHVDIVGCLPPSPRIAPTKLDFYFQRNSNRIDREIFVTDVPGAPIEILAVHDPAGGITSQIIRAPERTDRAPIRIVTSLQRTRAVDMTDGTLEIRTTCPFRPVIRIPYSISFE